MNNKKLVAGILTAIAAGAAISLILNTKKGREAGKEFLEKGNSLADDLKGRFGEFIDQIQDKIHGILK
jgi:gas vesicle protein